MGISIINPYQSHLSRNGTNMHQPRTKSCHSYHSSSSISILGGYWQPKKHHFADLTHSQSTKSTSSLQLTLESFRWQSQLHPTSCQLHQSLGLGRRNRSTSVSAPEIDGFLGGSNGQIIYGVLLENSNIPRYKGKNREIMMRSFKQS